MSSYILFSQTSTALGARDKWTDAAGSGGITAPGNSFVGSRFNADQPGSTVLPDAGAQADFAADGVRKTANAALYDISQTAGGALTANGASGQAAADALAGTNLFGAANTKIEGTSNVDASIGQLHLAQSDKNWNGVKNLEIKLDSNSTFRDIRLENFVDTRLQIGDDLCAVTAKRAFDTFDVNLLGVKRGEVDGTLATDNILLRIDAWSNESIWQNTFDLKASVYGDKFEIGAGNVTGSVFSGAASIHSGSNTVVFANMGAGNDVYDSTVSGAGFKAVDKVWGGTGDDTISTGAASDKLFGDNGSGADAYADPAAQATNVDDNFITDDIGGGPVPAFSAGPIVYGGPIDMGVYEISATGGQLVQLFTGAPATRAGGIGIANGSGEQSSLPDIEVDSRGGAEAITFDFKDGAHGVEFDLSAVFDNEGDGDDAEVVDFTVNFVDGSPAFVGSIAAVTDTVPAFVTLVIDNAITGGKLIQSVVLSPAAAPALTDGPLSDFYVAAVRACVITNGDDGNDILNAGTGADFVQGDGDTGSFTLPGETSFDFITGPAFTDQVIVDLGPVAMSAAGGKFAKAGDGATFGGLTVLSLNDSLSDFTGEIDAFNDSQEGVIFSFDGPGVTGFEMDLNLFFGDTFFEPTAEVADFILHVAGGPDIVGSLTATDLDAPGLLSFDFDTGDTGGTLITGFEIRPSLDLVGGAPYSEFTIAKLSVDDKMISTAGDRLDLGVDTDKDTVNFNDGDGFDVVKNFDTAKDVVRMQAGEAIAKTVVVDAVEGVGTLIEHGADGDGVFLVGVVNTAAITIITF